MTAAVERIAWYINRLRAMNANEIIYRVNEAAKRQMSKRRLYGWRAFKVAAVRLPALQIDRRRLALIDDRVRADWRAIIPGNGQDGIYRALGRTFTISEALDWHRDPTSELRWPDKGYCFSIPYRHAADRGDVKLVWEINRLQILPVMAAISACDEDDASAQSAIALIESWIDANPPFKGVHWASGIELALRVVSILLTVGLIGRERFDTRLSGKIAACLAAHAYWLARYPSRHSSANNHLIAEAAALYILGTLWPEHGMAREMAAARDTLIAEAFRQIHDDGVGAEQSPTYTAFTCEWYLLAFAVAGEAGTPFPNEVVARIASAGEHLRWLLDDSANHPRIGDDDEGRVIGGGRGHEPSYLASVVNAIAAATGRPDLAIAGATPQLRNLLFGWPDAAAPGPVGLRVFEHGGYTICRRRFAGRDALIAFDHGPLGYLSIAAHGHADALSVMLHIDSQPVFVDAGTYLYHAGGAIRDRLRGTAVHNTLCLDGANQSEIAGAFNWRRKADTRLLRAEFVDGIDRIVAEHDGYVRSHGLIHRRTMTIDARGLTIDDDLVEEGTVSRPVDNIEIGFLLHPDCSAVIADRGVVVSRRGQPLVRLSGGDNLVPQVVPADYSPAFGMLESTLRIAFVAMTTDVRAFRIRADLCSADSCVKSTWPASDAAEARSPVGEVELQ